MITRMLKVAQLKTCLYRGRMENTLMEMYIKYVFLFFFFLGSRYQTCLYANISKTHKAYVATNTLLLEQFLN